MEPLRGGPWVVQEHRSPRHRRDIATTLARIEDIGDSRYKHYPGVGVGRKSRCDCGRYSWGVCASRHRARLGGEPGRSARLMHGPTCGRRSATSSAFRSRRRRRVPLAVAIRHTSRCSAHVDTPRLEATTRPRREPIAIETSDEGSKHFDDDRSAVVRLRVDLRAVDWRRAHDRVRALGTVGSEAGRNRCCR